MSRGDRERIRQMELAALWQLQDRLSLKAKLAALEECARARAAHEERERRAAAAARKAKARAAAEKSAQRRAAQAEQHWSYAWFALAHEALKSRTRRLGWRRLLTAARKRAAAGGVALEQRDEISEHHAREFLRAARTK
jgi:hypothetical protein